MDKADEELCRSIGAFEVLRELAKGTFGSGPQSRRWQDAETWAKAEIAVLEANSSSSRDAREARTLAIAEASSSRATEANRIASEALAASRSNARWAMYAAIVATLALTVSIKAEIFALIFGTP